MTILVEFLSSKFPSWETLEGSGIQITLKQQKLQNVGNEEIDLKQKSLLSWQNVWNGRQIASDIEEIFANQVEVVRGGISPIYLSLSNKQKTCHGAINGWLEISEGHWQVPSISLKL